MINRKVIEHSSLLMDGGGDVAVYRLPLTARRHSHSAAHRRRSAVNQTYCSHCHDWAELFLNYCVEHWYESGVFGLAVTLAYRVDLSNWRMPNSIPKLTKIGCLRCLCYRNRSVALVQNPNG